MIDRRYLCYFDWTSFGIIISLLAMGLLFVFSATCKEDIPLSPFFKKQLFGALSGLVIYMACSFIELRTLCRWGYFGYVFVLIILAYTMVGGWIGMGAKRWISLYFVTFQPSEVVKLMLPLAFAFYFNEQKTPSTYATLHPPFKEFFFPLGILGASFVLILKQPDLGTALVILFSGIILLWLVQIPKSFFIACACIGLLGAPILFKALKPYQQQRIFVLLGYGDIRNERYQIEQSKIAIGSGGILGKGTFKGTQNRLSFLPEARTDFIFSVVCEEWGFLGALFIIVLFALLFIRLGYISITIPRTLEQLVAIGLLTPIILATVINMGMVSGLLPTVGIPLPLFTYGITHLWVTCASLGIINNIAIRRFLYY